MNLAEVASQLDHFEVFFHRATIGATPVVGYILPACARGQAFLRTSFFLFVDPAADQAHPGLVFSSVTHGMYPDSLPVEMGLAVEYAA